MWRFFYMFNKFFNFFSLILILICCSSFVFATNSTDNVYYEINFDDEYNENFDDINQISIEDNVECNKNDSNPNNSGFGFDECCDNEVINFDGNKSINYCGVISPNGVSPIEGYSLVNIFDCANRVRNYIDVNGVCPNYVSYYSGNYTTGVVDPHGMPDYLFLISKAIVKKYEGNNSNIMSREVYSWNINPSNPTGDSINGRIYAADFYVYAKNVVNWYSNNGGVAPNYVNTNLGKMQYQTAIYMFSRIGQYIYLHNQIPNYVTMLVPSSHSMNQYLPDYHPSEL